MTEKHCSPGSALPDWEDPDVQTVYNLMVDDSLNEPPHSQHWEGWIARHIVQALRRAPTQAAGHAAEIDRLHEMLQDREEFIANNGLWKEFSAYMAEPRTEPQEAWRPIETAPHEERVLLGWYQQETWFSETGMASHGWRRNGISNMSRHGFATHWRPLPDGPALTHPERS